MPGGGDDPRGGDERPRKSWREIDAARDRSRPQGPAEKRPRGAAAEARSAAASQQYLRQLEGSLFGRPKAGAEAERLARAVRDAHGTPGLDAACAAYQESGGIPEDPALVSLFLDARAPDLLVAVLDVLLERTRAGALPDAGRFRTQLRLLGQSSEDEVAERAEALLEQL